MATHLQAHFVRKQSRRKARRGRRHKPRRLGLGVPREKGTQRREASRHCSRLPLAHEDSDALLRRQPRPLPPHLFQRISRTQIHAVLQGGDIRRKRRLRVSRPPRKKLPRVFPQFERVSALLRLFAKAARIFPQKPDRNARRLGGVCVHPLLRRHQGKLAADTPPFCGQERRRVQKNHGRLCCGGRAACRESHGRQPLRQDVFERRREHFRLAGLRHYRGKRPSERREA